MSLKGENGAKAEALDISLPSFGPLAWVATATRRIPCSAGRATGDAFTALPRSVLN